MLLILLHHRSDGGAAGKADQMQVGESCGSAGLARGVFSSDLPLMTNREEKGRKKKKRKRKEVGERAKRERAEEDGGDRRKN